MSRLSDNPEVRRPRKGRHRRADGGEPPVPSSSEVWAALIVISVVVALIVLFVIPVLTMVL